MTTDHIFDDLDHRIEFHKGEGNRLGLFFTFTHFMFDDLDAEGFAVRYLLDRGYDVVAFKSVRNDWFQGLPKTALHQAAALGRGYRERGTYGSSMGGYAAIAFADMLGADRVIALSPQFSITDDTDLRWWTQSQAISGWPYRIEDGSCRRCEVQLIYDPLEPEDVYQIGCITAALASLRIEHVQVPLSSHPTTHFLVQTGQIARFMEKVLNRETDLVAEYRWSRLRNCRAYLRSLMGHAARNNRATLHALTFRRLSEVAPHDPALRRGKGAQVVPMPEPKPTPEPTPEARPVPSKPTLFAKLRRLFR